MTAPAPSTLSLLQGEHDVSFCAEVQDLGGTRWVPLPRGCFQVGTGRHCAIIMTDATVSGEHLLLVVEDQRVIVRDTDSKNGTFVGAVRVHEAAAHPGAVITVGRSTITLRVSAFAEQDAQDIEPLPGVAGGSLAMRRVAAQVRRLAPLRFPVLITGESGTGKELVAHALHALSPRKHKPFVAINVTSVPRDLVESEFFGHERGSFTGAVTRRRGAFEEADGGTLLLDEIGDLPLEIQPKLLRALDGYGIRSVGAMSTHTQAGARVVAATHCLLRERVALGAFRRDLFHRLEVFTIALPALRDRRADIGPIARALLRGMASDVGPKELVPAALARLGSEPWPGNVRELRNTLARAAAVARGALIEPHDVDVALGVHAEGSPARATSLTPDLARTMVREYGGNISAAARAAGCPRTTFRKLLAKHGNQE